MKIADVTPISITDLWAAVGSKVRAAKNLESAAQEVATALHLRFDDSVALARVFCTLSFDALPPANQAFVRKLAEEAEAAQPLQAGTPVLSLLGTHGELPAWNDRRKSRGHLGIPLISSAFVGAIPMISRLLKELGVPLAWVDGHDAAVIQKTLGRSESLFFVEDAAQAKDDQGRNIIAATDFVARHEIHGVFGLGGAYPDGKILVMVVFSHDRFRREAAEHFLPLTPLFKSGTEHLVSAGRIFAEA